MGMQYARNTGKEGASQAGRTGVAARRFFQEGSSELDFLGEKRMATITTMIIANDTHLNAFCVLGACANVNMLMPQNSSMR